MIRLYKQSDGTLISIDESSQKSTMPTASADFVGKIYQYIGATDANYTNGHFYKCKALATNPVTYKWEQVDVQESGTPRKEKQITTANDFRSAGQGAYSFITTTVVTITLADANTVTIPANTQGFFDVGEMDENTDDYAGVIQYVINGREKIIYFNSLTFTLPATDSVQIDDTTASTTTTYSSSKIETAIGGSKAAQMTGATAYQDGKAGLATKPVAGDNQKALFGDGRYHTIYAANTGSTIVVVTDEPTLYGRPVTLTAGSTTLTGTFSNTGECTFSNLAVYGAVQIASSDSEGNPSRGSTNLTYFGTYVVGIGFNFATLKFTSSDVTLAGTSIAIYKNNILVAETSLSVVGSGQLEATAYVEELGTYKAIAQTVGGTARASVNVTALRQTFTAELFVGNIYGFQIDHTDSNPATCVQPYNLGDYEVLNAEYTPAHMDYTNDVFDYGSWTGLATCNRNEIFFAPKPCMLRYDGAVDYYLDPNDYTKKLDGTASDVADLTYEGNCMVEFPTIYFKRWMVGDMEYVLIADKQVDIDFKAYAHHDKNGNVLPYIYLSAYRGYFDNTRLRSVSGQYPTTSTTRSQEITRAKANNITEEDGEGHYILHKADCDLVSDLLLLIGMSTDTQTTFGNGIDSASLTQTGMADNKGLFYGKNTHNTSVKVFGISDWWGNSWASCAGLIYSDGLLKVKMVYGQEDGSTVDGFDTVGDGYITIDDPTYFNREGYIKVWKKNEYGLVIIANASGSSTTFLTDVAYASSSSGFALFGGSYRQGDYCGTFAFDFGSRPDKGFDNTGALLTYKPLAS